METMIVQESDSGKSEQRKKDMLVYVGVDGSDSKPPSRGLQESFAKFREQKIKERRIMKLCQQVSLENGRTQEFKDALRMKFVDSLKRYVGTPYALRYKEPSDPVAPLYLDCCALVRQAVQDLQDEFGFIIGRWNQAYQIDTLPIVLTADQLKPGDLIFYEGEYYSNRSKPQKHNMVHVEVFLGGETGEACIGSRYHRGKVSIFPSYKFTSTTWKLVNYHFRSLDTWLSGSCVSCCPEHPWQSDALSYVEAAGKRSIFADENEEDVSAGGEDDEGEQGSTALAIEANDLPPLTPSDDPTSCRSPPHAPDLESKENTVNTSQSLPSSTSASASQGVKKPKRPSIYAPHRNSATRSSIPASTPCSASSANVGNTAGGGSSSAHPRSYYVGKSNGWKLVKAALDKRNWQQLPFDYQFSSRFGLKWVERRSQIDFRAHQPGQLVCHIPNNDIITTKLGLLTVLRDKYCRQSIGSATNAKLIPFLPVTYDLESPADVQALFAHAESLDGTSLTSDSGSASEATETDSKPSSMPSIWIYKPSCNNRGRGIKVVCGHDDLQLLCYGNGLPTTHEDHIPPMKGIVQKYIENPLLLTEVGLKFDIRCYLLIARNYPTTMAFYHPGYCRLALKPYSVHSVEALRDPMMHLTNASVQKKGEDYKENKEVQIQSMEMVHADLLAHGKAASAQYLTDKLDEDIKKCMADVLLASNGKLLKKHGYFDLLGCDFMLTTDNKLYLLEINTNPALSLDNGVLEALLPNVVDGALELVLHTQGPDVADLNSVNPPAELPGKFQLIFDESKHFAFGK